MTTFYNGGSGNLDQLKKKKITKPQPIFLIKLKNGNFHDKRIDLDIDRDSVLERLNKHINFRVIENKRKIHEKEIDMSNEYKIPLLDGKRYGEYTYDIEIEQQKPKKNKKIYYFRKNWRRIIKRF